MKVANGAVIKTQGVCKAVPILMQGETFMVHLHVLPMEGCDLVLGTHWLGTLGVIQWDFKLLTMSFYHEHRQVQLRGLKNATSQLQDGDNFLKQPVKKGLILQISVQLQPQLMYARGQGQTPEVIAGLQVCFYYSRRSASFKRS